MQKLSVKKAEKVYESLNITEKRAEELSKSIRLAVLAPTVTEGMDIIAAASKNTRELAFCVFLQGEKNGRRNEVPDMISKTLSGLLRPRNIVRDSFWGSFAAIAVLIDIAGVVTKFMSGNYLFAAAYFVCGVIIMYSATRR